MTLPVRSVPAPNYLIPSQERFDALMAGFRRPPPTAAGVQSSIDLLRVDLEGAFARREAIEREITGRILMISALEESLAKMDVDTESQESSAARAVSESLLRKPSESE